MNMYYFKSKYQRKVRNHNDKFSQMEVLFQDSPRILFDRGLIFYPFHFILSVICGSPPRLDFLGVERMFCIVFFRLFQQCRFRLQRVVQLRHFLALTLDADTSQRACQCSANAARLIFPGSDIRVSVVLTDVVTIPADCAASAAHRRGSAIFAGLCLAFRRLMPFMILLIAPALVIALPADKSVVALLRQCWGAADAADARQIARSRECKVAS